MKFIITAGGQGTKLWPMSRESKPKQFQNIIGDSTLFRYQIETLLKGYSASDIFISTKESYLPFVEKDLLGVPKENIIVEPAYKKNRGPGEGYAVLKVGEKCGDEPYMIVQSDCIRSPEDKFLEMIAGAEKLARRDRKFISGGQKAIIPDMGSDYLKLGRRIDIDTDLEIYNVEEFVYRLGDYQKTKDLIKSFHVSTHCNHTVWFPKETLDAYEKYMPMWHTDLMKIKQTFGTSDETAKTDRIYSEMLEGPTEEVTKNIFQDGYIILLPFTWTDVGTWDTLYNYYSKNNEIYKDGRVVDVESSNTLVKTKKDKVVALLGVENLVIVDTDDVLLVCSKDKTGDIKKILDKIRDGEDLKGLL